ncbi:unnamed protein product [Spodoptera exigua]|nr:unnamed protein product [Spodoptera exigua]
MNPFENAVPKEENSEEKKVYGSCNAIRMALLERGWVEKIPANRMNLSKIKNGTYSTKSDIHRELERLLLSNLVEKYPPNFIWRTRDELRSSVIDMTKECPTIINKLKTDAQWTSKQGLCSSMKRNYWFYIEDLAEVIGPRSYNTSDPGEIEGFVNDYKITACTSLLKWILSMVANERPIFVETGKISLNVVLFALIVIDFPRNSKSPTGRFECIYRQPMTIPRYGGALDLFVRGVSLPHDYFYKGNIDLRESYDCDVDMDKVNNIKAILDKIKDKYDSDTVMKEPEDDSNTTAKKEKETTTRHSRSEDELNVAASVITGQLEELLDRIVSNQSFSLINLGHQIRSLSSPVYITQPQPDKSINKIMKKSLSLKTPVKPITVNSERTFQFSELDDGPTDKGSYVGFSSSKKTFNDISELEVVRLLSRSKSKESTTSTSISTENMIEATTKLINFINQKQKEYFSENNLQR